MHGHHLDLLFSNPIYDTVVTENNLPDGFNL